MEIFARSMRRIARIVLPAVCAAAATAFAEEPDKWVRYVEATGSQFVDTGIVGRYGTKAECKVEWMAFSDSSFLASRSGWGDSRLYFCHCFDTTGRVYTAQGPGEKVIWNGGWECRFETNRVYTYVSEFSALDAGGMSTNTIAIDGLRVWSKASTGLDNENNLYVFACNVGGTAYAKSKTRCYGLKIWQDGDLVRDFQPCMKGDRAGLYDTVSKTIFYSGSGVDLVCDENSEVPDEFIEYVESQGLTSFTSSDILASGDQKPAYVDTGIIGRHGTKMEGEFAILASEDRGLLGSRRGDNRFYLLQSYKSKITCGYGAHKENTQTLELGKKYWVETELNAGSQTQKIGADGTTNTVHSGSVATAVDTDYPMYLFACNNNGAPVWYSKARCYGFKIWQGGDLVRDFKPCLKNGVAGLYDDVTKRIFYSLGTPLVFDNRKPVGEDDVMFVDYIESDGNNTLDTGVAAKSGTRAAGEMAWTGELRGWSYEVYRYLERTYEPEVFDREYRAYLAAENPKSGSKFFMLTAREAKLDFAYGSGGRIYLKSGGADISPTVGEKYSFDVSFADGSQTIEWNGAGVLATNIAGSVDTGNTLHLFSSSYWRNRSSARCYGLKIWQNGVLVRDLRPCVYREKGMLYDKVTKCLFRPSPDIPMSRTDARMSEEFSSYDLDTRANTFPLADSGDFAAMLPITFGTNDAGTITVRNPNTGETNSYTKAQWNAYLGGSPWNPGQGGAWRFTLAGSPSGSAVFNVGYAQYRTEPRHAGTMLDPEVLYYGGELAEYGFGGFVFRMAEGVDSGTLVTPSDEWGYLYLGEYFGNELFSLVEGDALSGHSGDYASFAVDTRQDSSPRVAASPQEIPPIAYTADGWAYGSSSAVSLSLTSPGGATTVHDATGTGSYDTPLSDLAARYLGRWRVEMSSGGGNDEAAIIFSPGGIFLMYK